MTSLEVRIGSLFRFPNKTKPAPIQKQATVGKCASSGNETSESNSRNLATTKNHFLAVRPGWPAPRPAIPAGGVCHYRLPAGLFECAGKAQRRRHFDCAGTLRRA